MSSWASNTLRPSLHEGHLHTCTNAINQEVLCRPHTEKKGPISHLLYLYIAFFSFMVQNWWRKFYSIYYWMKEWVLKVQLEQRLPHSLGCREQRCSMFSCNMTFQEVTGYYRAITNFDWCVGERMIILFIFLMAPCLWHQVI